MQHAEQLDEVTWLELRVILDEDIGWLSEKYRTPLVLCYFESKTRRQAAQELGWPEGTLARRLSRGREMLRQQLVRRGITLSAGMLSVVLTERAAAGPVAALLTVNTVNAAGPAGAAANQGKRQHHQDQFSLDPELSGHGFLRQRHAGRSLERHSSGSTTCAGQAAAGPAVPLDFATAALLPGWCICRMARPLLQLRQMAGSDSGTLQRASSVGGP
jgi:hypothetical protein